MENNRTLQGNAKDILQTLPDESIDMCITSPPYWGLRDYGSEVETIWSGKEKCKHEWGRNIMTKSNGGEEGSNYDVSLKSLKAAHFKVNSAFCSKCNAWKGQLGLEPTFDLYINHLCDIFDEVKRVLKNDGTCWVNLGDTYYGGGGGNQYSPENKGFQAKAFRKNSEYEKAGGFSYGYRKKAREVPDKSLCMIPFRFAMEMVARGWILRNVIIWHKPNCMPSSVKDRFTVDFEYLFFFVKGKKYFFKQQREPHRKESLKRIQHKWNGHREPMSSYRGMDIEKMCHPDGRNKRCVWTISTKGFRGAHFAVFPQELIETPIKAGCPEGGIVLDPFFGSGTTGLVALNQNKKFLGIELNRSYIKIAERRIESLKNGRQ